MIETGDVLVLLPRRIGPRARKILPVGHLTYRADDRQVFMYKGSPVVVTNAVAWRDQVFDYIVLPGHQVRVQAVRKVRRACCRAHLLGVGVSICCAHELDAEALIRWGGAWRHT